MIENDKNEKEKTEAKNSLEEYIYTIRDEVNSQYEAYVSKEAIFILKISIKRRISPQRFYISSIQILKLQHLISKIKFKTIYLNTVS